MVKDISDKLENLLRIFGNKVGLNLVYFVGNGFWVACRYLTISVAGLIISIAFTRLGTKELLGQYQFVLSVMAFLSIFSLPGLNISVLKSISQGQDAGLIKAVKMSFLASLFGSPIIIGYGILKIFQGVDIVLGATLILAGVLFAFFYAPNTWYAFYEGKSQFFPVSMRMIIVNIFSAIGLVMGLYAELNVFWMILIYLLINSVFHWIFFFEVIRKIKDKSRSLLDKKYGLHVSVQKFVYGLSNNIPPLAISFLFGFDFVAVYHITYYVIGTISGFLSSLSALYMPLLFKNIKLDSGRIVVQNIFIGATFLVGFLVFVRLFFTLLYGQDYNESMKLAYVISFLLILMPLRIFLINFFTTKNKNGLIVWTFLISNIVSFGIFYAAKNTGFTTSVALYLYALQFFVVAPLLFVYFSMASSKIDSIREDIKS